MMRKLIFQKTEGEDTLTILNKYIEDSDLT